LFAGGSPAPPSGGDIVAAHPKTVLQRSHVLTLFVAFVRFVVPQPAEF
jgi:hypothetical protein